jgi:hypothetical protein
VQVGRKLESLPADLTAAVEGGGIMGEIVWRFTDMRARVCSADCCSSEASGSQCFPTTSSSTTMPWVRDRRHRKGIRLDVSDFCSDLVPYDFEK